jgi:Na+/proline symporter
MNPKGGQWCRDPHPPFAYTAVFMITLLAAAMSTMNSQFHTMGSAIGHDIMEKGMGLKAEKPVRVIRLAILAEIQITTLTAYYLPSFFKDGAMIVANGTSLFFGLCARRFPQWPGGQRRHPLFHLRESLQTAGAVRSLLRCAVARRGNAVQGCRSARFRGAGLLALYAGCQSSLDEAVCRASGGVLSRREIGQGRFARTASLICSRCSPRDTPGLYSCPMA